MYALNTPAAQHSSLARPSILVVSTPATHEPIPAALKRKSCTCTSLGHERYHLQLLQQLRSSNRPCPSVPPRILLVSSSPLDSTPPLPRDRDKWGNAFAGTLLRLFSLRTLWAPPSRSLSGGMLALTQPRCGFRCDICRIRRISVLIPCWLQLGT